MDSNESHQGSCAGLWSDWEKIPGFQCMDTNESHQGSRASLWSEAFNLVLGPPLEASLKLGKDLRIPMDSNESHQGSRAGLWSEAFNLVMGPPPPGGFLEIGKGSQDSNGYQRISTAEPCWPLVGSF